MENDTAHSGKTMLHPFIHSLHVMTMTMMMMTMIMMILYPFWLKRIEARALNAHRT